MIEETAALATGQHLSLHFSSLSFLQTPPAHTGDNRLTAIFFFKWAHWTLTAESTREKEVEDHRHGNPHTSCLLRTAQEGEGTFLFRLNELRKYQKQLRLTQSEMLQ